MPPDMEKPPAPGGFQGSLENDSPTTTRVPLRTGTSSQLSGAETVLQRIATRLSGTHVDHHEPSFWLRSRLVGLTCRPLPTCGHNNPTFAALWRPEVVCALCAPTLRAQGEDDFRRDRCGVVEHPITLGAVVFHALLVSFGLCSSCAAKEYGEGAL